MPLSEQGCRTGSRQAYDCRVVCSWVSHLPSFKYISILLACISEGWHRAIQDPRRTVDSGMSRQSDVQLYMMLCRYITSQVSILRVHVM